MNSDLWGKSNATLHSYFLQQLTAIPVGQDRMYSSNDLYKRSAVLILDHNYMIWYTNCNMCLQFCEVAFMFQLILSYGHPFSQPHLFAQNGCSTKVQPGIHLGLWYHPTPITDCQIWTWLLLSVAPVMLAITWLSFTVSDGLKCPLRLCSVLAACSCWQCFTGQERTGSGVEPEGEWEGGRIWESERMGKRE